MFKERKREKKLIYRSRGWWNIGIGYIDKFNINEKLPYPICPTARVPGVNKVNPR